MKIKEEDWIKCPICLKWFVQGKPWEMHKSLPSCGEDTLASEIESGDLNIGVSDDIKTEEDGAGECDA